MNYVIGSVEKRFWAKVEKKGPDECWLWTASTREGYGCLGTYRQGRKFIDGAHRISYEIHVGPIPENKLVDHRCRVRLCVNPKHLQLATRKENIENHSGAYKNSLSGVRGVYWANNRKKWRVSVQHNKKKYEGGLFDSLEEAEVAAIALRNKLFTNNLVDRDAHRMGGEK